MISRGGYQDESEIVVAGLKLLQTREQLRSEVDAGIKQLEDGQGLEGEAVFARLEERAQQIANRTGR
jgi:antitoxin ParD1/3/4